MGKSLIYAGNSSSQALATGSVVSFGEAIRRFGCNCGISGGNPIVRGAGYYEGTVSLTFTASAGNPTFTVYKDGVAIPNASATLTTVADTTYQVVIPFVAMTSCNCESTITVVSSGVATTINNASIVIEKE